MLSTACFDDLKIFGVHNACEEAIIIIHSTVVDWKLLIIGNNNKTIASCLFDSINL